MKRRLLLDSDVVEVLDGLPTSVRNAIWRRFQEIAKFPDQFEDFQERDSTGRQLSGHVFGEFAILYWDDLADRHVKVLEVLRADDLPD